MPKEPGVKSGTPDIPAADHEAKKKMDAIQEKYRAELKKDCLPLPGNLDINNIPISAMTVIDQYKGEPCEMMNEIRFHLDEKRGKNAGQIAWELIKIFKVPDEGDVLQEIAETFAKHAIPVAKIYSTLSDLKDLGEFIDSEIQANRLHGQYLEAIDIYRTSKGWSMTEFQNQTGALYSELKSKMRNIKRLESELYSECKKNYPRDSEISVYGGPVIPGTKIPNDAMIWQRYYEKIGPIETRYDAEIRTTLKEIIGIELKIKFLEDYRKPLIEKPCKETIEARKKDCPGDKPDDATKPPEPPKTLGTLADKDKSALYGCLCACLGTIGATGGYYPEKVPDCMDPSWGPCMWGNWGCNRDYMPTSGDCFKGCAAGAGINPDSLASQLNGERREKMEGLLSESTRLIDEFWYSSPEPFADRVVRKTKQGDIARSAALADQAGKIEPPLKTNADNIKKDTSKRVSFLAGRVIAEKLDFQTAFSILESAVEIDKDNADAKGKLAQVKKWQQDWNTIQDLVPACLSIIKDRRPCECKKLFDEKIGPANASFTIPILFVNPLGGGGPGNDRVPVPQKEKMVRELNDTLNAVMYRECKQVPGVQTALSSLQNYMQYHTHPNYGGINDEQAVKTAEDALAIKGLCDCDRNEIDNVLKAARDNIEKKKPKNEPKPTLTPASKPPAETPKPAKLTVSLMADRKVLKVGESSYIAAAVTGGKAPYTIMWGGAVTGKGSTVLFKAQTAGLQEITSEATDSAGNKGSGSISLNVEAESPPVKAPPAPVRINVSLYSDRNTLKINESAHISASVSGGQPPYSVTWGGDHSGSGTSTTFQAKKAGTNTVVANVTDSRGNSGSASISLNVSNVVQMNPNTNLIFKPPANPQTSPKPESSPKPPSSGYDPTKDWNVSGGQKSQPVDISQVEAIGSEFQEKQNWNKPKDPSADGGGKNIVQQPEDYMSPPKAPGDQTGKENTPSYYPPEGPQTGKGPGPGRDWSKWATETPPESSGGWTGEQKPPKKPPTQPPAQPPAAPPVPTGGLSDVTVSSPDITISVWDHGQVDNDIINIKLNGNMISGGSHLVLTASPKEFRLKLAGGNNKIEIEAVNEGMVPPNTASIKISNVSSGKGQQTYSINQNSSASFTATVK